MNKTKLMHYPVLITIIGAISMLLMLLLPYASAIDEHKEWLENNKDEMYIEEIDMTKADAINISLLEFGKMYIETAKQDIEKEVSIVCVVVISIFAGMALFTLLMGVFRKPVGIIIFDLLTVGVFKILCYDFEDRGVIPSSSYEWGIVYYLVYVIGVIILIGAIWLFVEKRKAKK